MHVDFKVHTNHVVQARRPHMIVIDKKIKKAQAIHSATPLSQQVGKERDGED